MPLPLIVTSGFAVVQPLASPDPLILFELQEMVENKIMLIRLRIFLE